MSVECRLHWGKPPRARVDSTGEWLKGLINKKQELGQKYLKLTDLQQLYKTKKEKKTWNMFGRSKGEWTHPLAIEQQKQPTTPSPKRFISSSFSPSSGAHFFFGQVLSVIVPAQRWPVVFACCGREHLRLESGWLKLGCLIRVVRLDISLHVCEYICWLVC